MGNLSFKSNCGSVYLDFEKETVFLERTGVLSNSLGLINMEINMRDITHIELREPGIFKGGCFNLIVNGIRYVTKKGDDATHFDLFISKDFPELKLALQRILGINRLNGFCELGSVDAPRKEYEDPHDEGVVYKLENHMSSTLKVYDNRIVLSHHGLMNYLNKNGLKGEKTVLFSSISAIEMRPASSILNGYIQFSVFGSERSGGISDAANDENAIVINENHNELARQIVAYIERRKEELSQPQNPPTCQVQSSADEILKFKRLLDAGIITQEEFEAKKKQLLNM